MPCSSCGRADGTLHQGEWISAKSIVDRYSYLSSRTGLRVGVTRTTYENPTACSVALCNECLAKQALKSFGTPYAAMFGTLGVFALVLALAATSPKVGVLFRVVAALVVGIPACLLLWVYILIKRRYRRAKLFPSDELFLYNYALAIGKEAGRDALFSLGEWGRLVEESARSVEDDPLDPQKVRVAIRGVVQGLNSQTQKP